MANCFIVADPDKCIGCRTCEIACVVAHSSKDIFTAPLSQIEFFPRLNVIKTAAVSAPIQCRQCEDAPCAKVCPVKCITTKNGRIHVDEKECIGCKTCAIACPIGAIDMVTEVREGEKILQARLRIKDHDCSEDEKERIIAHKCDLCGERLEGPACAEVCPTKAFKIVKQEDLEKMLKQRRKNSAEEIIRITNQGN